MPFKDIFLAILVAVIWGGNFIAARYGMEHFPPFLLTALRFTMVALVLIAFVPLPTRSQLWQLLQLAACVGVLHFALLFAAMYEGLDIASCAIVGQMGVPFSCLLSAIFLRDRLGLWRIAGMVMAFMGMIVVAGATNIVDHPTGFVIALAGSFFWGVGNIIIKRTKDVSSFQMLTWMSVFSVPQLLLVSLLFENNQWELLFTGTLMAWGAMAYSALVSSIVGYGLWYYLLKHYPVTQVSPYSLLTPVFGIAFGQLFFAEALSWETIVGGLVTIAGVAVIVMRRPKLAELGEAT